MSVIAFSSIDNGWVTKCRVRASLRKIDHTGAHLCVSPCLPYFRYATSPSPEDKRYRDSLSPPCATLVVDNVSPEVSAEDITSIFAKVR